MSMRVSGALICLGILVTACGTTQTQAGSGDKLYAAVSTTNSQFVQVIDSRSHKVERRLPMGVPSSDWKHLYSLVSTSLVDTDPQMGATLSTLALGHAYRLPDATSTGVPGGLSPNGKWLVVERYDVTGEDLPSASHFLLIETPGLKIKSRIDLAGPFIHALSLDAPIAFCLDLPGSGYAEDGSAMQWSLALSPGGSTVYAANLASGEVATVGIAGGAPQIVHKAHIALTTSTGGLIKNVEAKELGGNAAVVSLD